MMEITEILGIIGEKIAEASAFTIKKLSELGVNIGSSQAKIINILVILVALYLFIKVIEIPKPAIKVLIIILLLIFGISTIFSLF